MGLLSGAAAAIGSKRVTENNQDVYLSLGESSYMGDWRRAGRLPLRAAKPTYQDSKLTLQA